MDTVHKIGCSTLLSIVFALTTWAQDASHRTIPASSVAQADAPATPRSSGTSADPTALAKKVQNPVSDLISLPFQNSWNYGMGPERRTQWILNIQPVVPMSVSEKWNLIIRTIFPLTDLPIGANESQKGSGDTTLSLFLSPREPGKMIWGIGPVLGFPTASDTSLGSGKWTAGPTVVALKISGPWVVGALVSNSWSFAGDATRGNVNFLFLQPFLNYNVPKAKGFAFAYSPFITADWNATSGQKWTFPLGGGISQTFVAGKQPMSVNFHLYYNVVRPNAAPNWQIRFQWSFLFPKG